MLQPNSISFERIQSVDKDARQKYRREIEELRAKLSKTLKKYPSYNTDYSLLRWLRGYNYDIDLSAKKMAWALNTLNAVGAFNQDFSSIEKIHEAVRAVTPIAEYFPGGLLGIEKNGYLLNIHNIGLASPGSLIGAGRVSEFYIAAIYDCEGSQHLIRAEEARRDQKLGVIMIIDMKGFSYDVLFHIPATRIYINMLLLIQSLFPDTAKRLYIVNASFAMNILYQMVRMALAKETVENFQVLGSNWKEILAERHGAENLPMSCGGTKNDDLLRKGGEIPSSVKSKIKTMHISMDNLLKITISARSELRIPFEVKEDQSKICWYFTCSSGDIDFAILHNGEEVWPCFRINTDWSPEFGEIICANAGVYELYFSNKHGLIWGKQIQYMVKINEDLNKYCTKV